MTDRPVPGPPRDPSRPSPAEAAADSALEDALERLEALRGVPVHEHPDAFAEVDRALRERLAAAED
ncbi:hypothetical protein [Kineococcus terrestris]|uniref:hypothetical protein n=1 Tax=Kineococcus terrestris TaxID=2044856 RepID=UPI0034DB772D